MKADRQSGWRKCQCHYLQHHRETAKANNLNPFRYLEHVLTVLKDHQDDREYSFIDDILPWSEKLPAICRSKTKATNI